jgi:hypothetical protein
MPVKGSHIPLKSREAVKQRAMGRCERCGGPGSQWHHRRGRSVKDLHRHCPCNGVWLCPTCHTWAHAHPEEAREEGFIVSRAESSPGRWGLAHYQGRFVRPDCQGGWQTSERGDQDVLHG